jgi:hypothetical protein
MAWHGTAPCIKKGSAPVEMNATLRRADSATGPFVCVTLGDLAKFQVEEGTKPPFRCHACALRWCCLLNCCFQAQSYAYIDDVTLFRYSI